VGFTVLSSELIDKSTFGKVAHSLVNDWDWDKISKCAINIAEEDPRRYKPLGDGGFACWGFERFFPEVLSYMKELKPDYQPRAQLFCSTTATSKSFDLHSDPGQYLWIWQVIGSTPWQVENEQFVLHENEMLYIDNELLHCAMPNSPRASFTFSLEKEHFYG
jgi:hypothetical protein